MTAAGEVTEIEMCFFAALIDGLRLINEKEEEGRPVGNLGGNALIDYAQTKGKTLIKLLYPGTRELEAAKTRIAWRPGAPVVQIEIPKWTPRTRPEVKKLCESLREPPPIAQKAEPSGVPTLREHRKHWDLSHIDILMALELRLLPEIRHFAKNGFGDGKVFDEAVRAFKARVGL